MGGEGGHRRSRAGHVRGRRAWQRAGKGGADDRHLARRERSGLVGADGRGRPHGLARGEVPHEVLVAHHLLHREGECDRDGKREALGHCDDEDGHAHDNAPQQLEKVNRKDERLAAARALPRRRAASAPRTRQAGLRTCRTLQTVAIRTRFRLTDRSRRGGTARAPA